MYPADNEPLQTRDLNEARRWPDGKVPGGEGLRPYPPQKAAVTEALRFRKAASRDRNAALLRRVEPLPWSPWQPGSPTRGVAVVCLVDISSVRIPAPGES